MRAQIQTIILEGDREVIVTRKRHAFNLFQKPGNNLWTYDLEGRLMGMYVEGVNYRRTLDNRYFKKERRKSAGTRFRTVQPVPLQRARALLDRGRGQVAQIRSRLEPGLQEIGSRIEDLDMARLQEQARAFGRIYRPIAILPPDQYLALVLQVTEGCNYNQCLFCNFYRDRPFRIKTLDEVGEHLAAVKRFFGAGLRLRKTIFLADANALVIPQARLLPILRLIRRSLPQYQQIYSFIDVFTGNRKTARAFKALNALGLKRVYLGIESGHPGLLQLLKKPQAEDDILNLIANLKTGGIQLGLILLSGAGGAAYHRDHVRESARLLKRILLSKGDLVYISEFYQTNLDYRVVLEERGITLPSRTEIRTMTTELKAALRRVVPREVRIPVYDIQQFFY